MDTLRALRVLGLPPSANSEEIQGAWRDLARVWHPDRFAHDARLQAKAGENLKRINEAHEALRGYDPAQTPKLAARVRASVAIILGMGELGEPPASSVPVDRVAPPPPPPPAPPPAMIPSAPIGMRNSLRVLGLGVQRLTGEAGTRRSDGNLPLIAIIVIALVVLAVAILLLRS